jgi:hypothetical protein
MAVYQIIASPKKINKLFRLYSSVHNLPRINITNSAYLSRAVSTVPNEMKPFLEIQYKSLIEIVKESGIEPLIPVELSPNVDINEINPKNDEMERVAKFLIPLCYAISDGRSFEHGVGYAIAKPTIPLLLKGQKINIPTIRRPCHVPIIFEDFSKERDSKNLLSLLREFQKYDYGTGLCSIHGKTLIGFKKESYDKDCMRCVASNYFEVVSAKIY